MSAAQLREQKLLAGRSRKGDASQRQKELSMIPSESLTMSTNVPKKKPEASRRRRHLIQQVFYVESEEEDVSSGSREEINTERKMSPVDSGHEARNVSALKRKTPIGEGTPGPSSRQKVVHGQTPNEAVVNVFQDSGLKCAAGEKKNTDGASTGKRKGAASMEYQKLADEIGDVPVLRDLDLHCTEGDGLKVGIGIMKRVVDFGYQEKVEDSTAEAIEVFGRMGLNVTEFSTGGSILVNKIALLDDARKTLENMLANANKLLEEKEEESFKSGEQLSKVEQQLVETKKKLKELQEKEASYVTRLEEMENTVKALEKEKKEYKEDQAQWFNERDELLSKAADASATAWSEFVKQYEVSEDFQKRIDKKVVGCYEEGMYHALRMAAGSNVEGITPEILAEWGGGLHFCEQARRGHVVVPYTTDEVTALRARDAKENLPVYELAKPLDVNVKTLLEVVDETEKDGESGEAAENEA